MTHYSDRKCFEVAARLSLLSLYILIGANALLIAIGYAIHQTEIAAIPERVMMTRLFLVLGIVELGVLRFVKGTLLAKLDKSTQMFELPVKQLQRISIILTAMCASISVYGLIAIILGADFGVIFLFVAISLIGYQLFRLRPKDLEKLLPR